MIPVHHPPIDYEGILEKMNLRLFQGSLYQKTALPSPALPSPSLPSPVLQTQIEYNPQHLQPHLKSSYIYQKYFKNEPVHTPQSKQTIEQNRKRNYLQNIEKRKLLLVDSGLTRLIKTPNTFFKMK